MLPDFKRTLIHLTLFFCFPPASIIAQTLSPVEHFEMRKHADAATTAGNFEQAAELYRQLAEQTPENPELWTLLVDALYALDRPGEAVGILAKVLDMGYTLDESWTFEVARQYLRSGDHDSGLDWMARALEERYSERPGLRQNDDFAELSQVPRFRRLAGIPPDGLSRTEAWRFDLAYFVEEAQRLHADPEQKAFSPAFETAVETLFQQIPELSDEEIWLDFMRLAALLNDGHTAMYGPGDDSPLQWDLSALPVKFYLFEDGLFVVDADSAWKDLIGSKVKSIGALSPEESLERLSAFRGVDNPMTMKWLGVQFFLRRLVMLRAIGATNNEVATLTFEGKEGDDYTAVLPGTTWNARRKLRAPAVADTTLWLRHVGKNYWMHKLPEGLYVQFNQVRNERSGASIAAFFNFVSSTLLETEARELIIDLRHNNGGNNSLVRPLLRHLIAWEMSNERNRIWVLTGRNTFSAAQNFLNQVERLTDAIIVGEPSASRPNFIGEETSVELPWSRIRGSISTRYWQDSDPTDHRQWIYPDVPIGLNSKAYFANHDPVLEAVRAIISSEE